MAGDEISDDFRALAVIDGNFLVQAVETVGGVVRAGTHRQHRQPGLQGATAEFHQAWVGLGVAGQQQAGQRDAVHGSEAHGQDNVVAISRGNHQHARFEQLQGVEHRACAEDDFRHATGFIVPGIEHLGSQQFGHIAGAWSIQLGLKGNAAQQLEITTAQQRRMLFEACRKSVHAFVGAHLVEDHAQHFRVFWPAKQLGLQLHPTRQLGQHFVFRGRDQDHFSIQALGQVQVDPCRVAGRAGGHHAFDNQHVLADGRLLIEVDDFFEQLIELAVTQHALDMGQAQRGRRLEAVGAGHQFSGALRPQIPRVRLGNGLEKPDFKPGALKSANQAQANGCQTHTKIGGRDKESLHASFLTWQCKGNTLYTGLVPESIAKISAIRLLSTPATGKGLAYFGLALPGIKHPRPGLPGRLMALVLCVATGEHGNPVLLLILTPANDR